MVKTEGNVIPVSKHQHI